MPRILLAAGAVLFAVAAILAVVLHRPNRTATTVTVTVPARPATTTSPAPPSPPPSTVAMSWSHAGALVWHPGDVDPGWLGQQMRAAGFGWLAIYLGEPGTPAPPDPHWLLRFKLASGLPVGGWSVLGDDPAADAASVTQLIRQDDLAFYIADAEAPYGYTEGATVSNERLGRSTAFVAAFRAAEPDLPAAVSSYCRPDQHDLDWNAWAGAGFDFLPQAYVNDFGAKAAPAECVAAAARWFPEDRVHPTVASYSGVHGIVPPARFVQLLRRAGTTGFSIYPAEAGMSAENWQAYGRALPELATPAGS